MQRTLSDTLPPVSQWDRSTLHLFIQTALECCDGKCCLIGDNGGSGANAMK